MPTVGSFIGGRLTRFLREPVEKLEALLDLLSDLGLDRGVRDHGPGFDWTALARKGGRSLVEQAEEVFDALDRRRAVEVACRCDELPEIFEQRNTWMLRYVWETLAGSPHVHCRWVDERGEAIPPDQMLCDPELVDRARLITEPHVRKGAAHERRYFGGVAGTARRLLRLARRLGRQGEADDAVRGRGGHRAELNDAVPAAMPKSQMPAIRLAEYDLEWAAAFVKHIREDIAEGEREQHLRERLEGRWVVFPATEDGVREVPILGPGPVEESLLIALDESRRISKTLVREFLGVLLLGLHPQADDEERKRERERAGEAVRREERRIEKRGDEDLASHLPDVDIDLDLAEQLLRAYKEERERILASQRRRLIAGLGRLARKAGFLPATKDGAPDELEELARNESERRRTSLSVQDVLLEVAIETLRALEDQGIRWSPEDMFRLTRTRAKREFERDFVKRMKDRHDDP